MIIGIPVDQFSESLEKLQDSWLVSYAEPNALVETHGRQLTAGPAAGALNGVFQTQTENQPPVVVAVIDSGIDIEHAALKANIWVNPGEDGSTNREIDRRTNDVDDDRNGYIDDWVGWNFVDGNNQVLDFNGHGTHTAGIIVAQSAGRAVILPVKALDASGLGSYAGAAEAIIYAVDQGAVIIHLGFGGLSASRTLQEAVDYAYEHDVLVISAAGNSGDAALWYPAALPRVLAVAAVDENNARAPFSSIGEHISLAAPGVDITSTYPGGGTTIMSGTSMSAAFVSGTAAQLAALPQFDTPDKMRAALQNTALDLGQEGFDTYTGYGLVQPEAALAYAVVGVPTPIPWEEIAPTPLSDGGVQAMATVNEELWGTTQVCDLTFSGPGGSTDLLFNGSTDSCTGKYAQAGSSWTYTAVEDITAIQTVTSASLDVRYELSSGIQR
jgi:subtilisin family serine protease